MLRRADEVRMERKPGRAKGKGEFECRYLVEEGENENGIQFVHDDTLDPGASFGTHRHIDSEEIYLVLDGTGQAWVDDDRWDVGPGDVVTLHKGQSHGIEANADGKLRFLAIGIGGPKRKYEVP
ncbi:MAG TPA: cupin domain-containing protein [Thermoleophilaceae bacterium]